MDVKLRRAVALVTLGLGSLAPVLTMASDAPKNVQTSGYQVIETQVAPVTFTKAQFGKLPQDQQERIAKIWGISRTEYQQYLYEMHNTPSGKWYKQLNPAEVLMINAKNEGQRMAYAKVVAKNAHDRGNREMSAQRAYNQAWQILYPHLPRVRMPHGDVFEMPALQSGDMIVYFTKIDSSQGNSTLQTLLQIIEKQQGVKLKIYIEGSPSTEKVEHWANAQKLPRDLYQNGVISMKVDSDGYFNELTHDNTKLPFVALDSKGHLKPVPTSSLWMWQE